MIYKENENRNQQRHIIPNNDNKDEKKIEMSLGYDMTELLSTFSVLPLSSLSGWFVMLISSFSRQLRIQPQSKENKIKLNSKLCVQCTWILSQKCSSLEFACNSHLLSLRATISLNLLVKRKFLWIHLKLWFYILYFEFQTKFIFTWILDLFGIFCDWNL